MKRRLRPVVDLSPTVAAYGGHFAQYCAMFQTWLHALLVSAFNYSTSTIPPRTSRLLFPPWRGGDYVNGAMLRVWTRGGADDDYGYRYIVFCGSVDSSFRLVPL